LISTRAGRAQKVGGSLGGSCRLPIEAGAAGRGLAAALCVEFTDNHRTGSDGGGAWTRRYAIRCGLRASFGARPIGRDPRPAGEATHPLARPPHSPPAKPRHGLTSSSSSRIELRLGSAGWGGFDSRRSCSALFSFETSW